MTGATLLISLQVLALQWQSSISLPEVPTHHRGHRHLNGHHKDQGLVDKDAGASDRLRDSEVTLTAGGSFQSGHSMMRRESDSAIGEKHHHDRHNTKALFQAMDLNGDGKITKDEINHVSELFAASPDEVQKRGLHIANMVVEDVDADGDGAIDFNEFVSSMHQSLLSHHHAHKEHRQSTGAHAGKHHKKRAKAPYSAVEETDAEPYYSTVEEHRPIRSHFDSQAALSEFGPNAWVSCGAHNAPSCAECPNHSPQGSSDTSHGSDFCHGVCEWCSSGGQAGVCIHSETLCSTDGASHDEPPPKEEKTPDLLDKKFTDKDKEISDKAAAAAIREEEEEEAKKALAEEDDEFDKRKFWLIVVITFSVILGICAIVSIITLVVFYWMGVSEEAPKELLEEGEEDGEQGEEGEGDDEEEPVAEEEEPVAEEEEKPKNKKEKLATTWMQGVSNLGAGIVS